MNSIKNRLEMKNKSILIFGAGKIGRSFIGQVFGLSGYEVIFADFNLEIVHLLNERKSYPVIIKGEKEEIIQVPNVRAVSGLDEAQLVREISEASILAISVGKNALEKVIPVIGEGLKLRHQVHPDCSLDIIIAENMPSANDFISEKLLSMLPSNYPFNRLVGIVETNISKMVPMMPKKVEQADPLLVYSEPYITLIVDRKGFKNPIPGIKGLSAKGNIKAWVDRNTYIHDLGYAAAAFYGYYKYPGMKYLYEVLGNMDALCFTIEVMEQSAHTLSHEYPDEFKIGDLFNHIKDLISRFRNKALGDTVFRIGCDLQRKLGKDDRVVGAIRLAQKHNYRFNKILETLVYGLLFRATEDSGVMYPGDQAMAVQIEGGLRNVLNEVCGFDLNFDKQLIGKIEELYELKLILLQNEQR